MAQTSLMAHDSGRRVAYPDHRPHRGGFTLVELTAVIVILIVLLGAFVPALSRMIYNLEFARCALQMAEVARSASLYAADYSRTYPHRQAIVVNGEPAYILQDGSFDDRPLLAPYFPLDDLLNDPLGGRADLTGAAPGTLIHAGINLWFGVVFRGTPPTSGLLKTGQTLEWTDPSKSLTHRVRWLASDLDVLSPSAGAAWHSHPDSEGRSMMETSAAPSVYARWEVAGTHQRGQVDLNAAREDGAVDQVRSAAWDDERLIALPHRTDATDWPTWYARVPPR